MHNLRVAGFQQGEPADDLVGASGEPFQRRCGILRRRRFAVDLAAERDDGVDAENRLVGALDRRSVGLGERVRLGDLDRVAGRELLDVDDEDLEGDVQLLEDRPALGGAAGEDEGRDRYTPSGK